MVLLEILVIPGMGVAGVLGFLMMAAAVFLSYSRIGTTAGHYVLAGTIIVNLSFLVLALRANTWNRLMLKKNVDSRVNLFNESGIKAGDTGTTISRCAPSGKALINDEFYEVHARSEFIDEDQPIEVIKVEFNKIFVKHIKNN
jgi:membrane-bound ClpP family serine protease